MTSPVVEYQKQTRQLRKYTETVLKGVGTLPTPTIREKLPRVSSYRQHAYTDQRTKWNNHRQKAVHICHLCTMFTTLYTELEPSDLVHDTAHHLRQHFKKWHGGVGGYKTQHYRQIASNSSGGTK